MSVAEITYENIPNVDLTSTELTALIQAAEECFALTSQGLFIEWSHGVKGYFNTAVMELYLYIKVLKEWMQYKNGTEKTNNYITKQEFSALVYKVRMIIR